MADLISVVIPFLNEEKHLPACLRALQAQSLPAHLFEVILVDNGSSDRSVELAKSFAGAIVLHESQRDPYLARNRGIEAARGRYVVFLDADCLAEPRWLEKLVEEMDRSSAPVILGYLAFPEGSSRLLRRHEEYYHTKLRHLLVNRLHAHYFGHAGNMAVRRDVFTELGPFPAMPIVGDTEIIHRVLGHWPRAEIVYAPEARVVHSEVTSLVACLQKLYECGGYSEAMLRVSEYRPLPLSVKWRIFRHAAAEHEYGPWATAESAIALFAGWVSFRFGRLQ